MPDTTRNLHPLKSNAAVVQLNRLRLDMLRLSAGVVYHADASDAVTTADASDLPTAIALVTSLQTSYTAHIASECDQETGIGAHLADDAVNVLAAPTPTDEATAITAVNELKTQYNLHRASTTFHASADTVNVVAVADASDLATLVALANDVKTQLDAHMAGALASQAILLVSP